MSTIASLSQQSPLVDNAYLSLTNAIRGNADVKDDNEGSRIFFIAQTGASIRLGQASAERSH